MPDLDLVETLPDNDVVMIGMLYFITTYLFPRNYKKVVDHFLFVLVEDFSVMNQLPWGKLLFEITLSALKDGLSRKNSHYRLRGMLVAFQAWIYDTFPRLDGVVIEICDLEPSKTEMAMPYMNGVQYKKPGQPKFSPDSHRDKSRIERSVDRVGTSGKSAVFDMLVGHQKSDHGVGDKDPPIVGGSDKTKEENTVEPNVDRKGKGKLDPTHDIVLPYTLEAPSFDLRDTTTAKPTSELLVKWVSRPAKILQSPFVAREGKLFKHDDIVVFENYKGRVDEVDSSAFMA
ncbi:Hypothetical predicted protein [Olea europaea subsp. europaea]|uniref:Aminotransferase-like plant mobile domain-containing protein n=1 Tax=Olea europaea subsp. europaea TaxID=158383 RepID=A0A8S0TM48_OLEEU|nr:Hypothetical predicted protein [Olea europaea subsp. europaea]